MKKQCLTIDIQRNEKSLIIAQTYNLREKKKKVHTLFGGLVAGCGGFGGPVTGKWLPGWS